MLINTKKKIIRIIRDLDNAIYDNVGKIRVLFIIRNDIGFQCLLPIINKCKNDKLFSIRITIEKNGCFDYSKNLSEQNIKNLYVSNNIATLNKWHYIFTTDNTNLHFLRDATIIATRHGSSFGNLPDNKKEYSEECMEKWNISLSFLNSNARLNDYISNKNVYNDKKQILVAGFAKTDLFIKNNFTYKNKFSLLSKYFKNPTHKLIVIYSHWLDASLFNSLGVDFLEKLCNIFPQLNFIVLGHPLLWKNHDGSNKESQKFNILKEIEKKSSNLTFLPLAKNTTDILLSSDLFIGDNSTLFTECCIVDKPIIYYESGIRFYDSKTYSLYKKASTSFSRYSELEIIIKENINNPEILKKERKDVVDYFLFQPGNATNYITQSLKEIGKVSGPNSKSWYKLENYCAKEMLSHLKK